MRKLNVGVIGCGQFVRGMHIPNLLGNPSYSIHATMDVVEDPARKTAEETKASYWTTDVDKILADKEINVVFITTRHDSHAALSVKAAAAGKHILCEKPMGLDADECRAVVDAVRRHKVKYTVGYNRGLAPLVLKARGLLADLTDKKLVYHRMQAPFPADIWTHDPKVGGGRFVGEGCHSFDLMCEMIKAPPVSVYAAGGTFLDPAKVKVPDSAVVTVSFADGSVGTTLIASAGCAAFPKESIEVYCAGKAIWINDFKEMEYCGFEGQERIRLAFDKVDKGQATEIGLLADAILNDTEPPNGVVNAARAALISYKVAESIASGMPIPISQSEYEF